MIELPIPPYVPYSADYKLDEFILELNERWNEDGSIESYYSYVFDMDIGDL